MAIIRITTTRQRDFQPLGTAGQTAVEAWSVLSTMVSRELSPAHAALFAEPVIDAMRGETDWYTEGDSPPIPISLADPTVRAAVLDEKARLERDIRGLAVRKRSATEEGDRFLGEMLGLALSIPSDAQIYMTENRPVLVAWGHAPAGGSPEQVQLVGLSQRAPLPMTILPPPVIPTAVSLLRRWLPLSLLAALSLVMLALLLLLFDPFGWYNVIAPQCRVAEGQPALLAVLRQEAERESALRAQLAQITDEAGQRHLRCPPIVVQAPPPQPSQQPQQPPSPDAQRATERGAHQGKLQIILTWEDRNDLDLHVQCPGGHEIYHAARSSCGGQLDVDANADTNTATATPVENVFFSDPPPGPYRVIVDSFAMRVAVDSRFRVTIRREGKPDQVVEGVAQNGQHRQVVTEFEIAPPDTTPR